MEVKGKIEKIDQTKTFSGGFRKRDMVVVTEEEYPQYLLLEFIQDGTDELNKYSVGDRVEIGVNLKGRKWVNPEGETKYFNSIQGWRIKKLESKPADQIPPAGYEEEEDDLPY